MKTIIAGSRNITDYNDAVSAIKKSGFAITEIVSGGAKGVDALGERYGMDNNIPVRVFPADWENNGRGAGHIRNTQMAEYAEALIAIWDGTSPGTFNMIQTAKNKGLKVYVEKLSNAQILKEMPRIPWKEE